MDIKDISIVVLAGFSTIASIIAIGLSVLSLKLHSLNKEVWDEHLTDHLTK